MKILHLEVDEYSKNKSVITNVKKKEGPKIV